MSTMKTLFGWVNLYLDENVTSTHRVVDKKVVIGVSDPRRQKYLPNAQPGAEIHVPALSRFDRDLFFIAPFYHRLLHHLDQVVVIDLDLEFRWDNATCLTLSKQGWGGWSAESLLPAWWRPTHGFRQRPVLILSVYHLWLGSGTPGKNWAIKSKLKSQGVNAGLMLFQLDKMRESEEYNEELGSDAMRRLSNKFLPRPEWSLAAQDWFSILSWVKPHLVARLPCRFNVMFCSTVLQNQFANFSNIPCDQETAIAHFCGIEINI